MTLLQSNPGEKVLTSDTTHVWTQQAREEFVRMSEHVAALQAAYGHSSTWASAAALSLARASSSLHGWGDLRITRDGPLSLFCQSQSLVFGLIFHGISRRCTRDGCHAQINDDGHIWTYSTGQPVCADGLHTPNYALDAPVPGTWSFHS